jgi:hypothetical protein
MESEGGGSDGMFICCCVLLALLWLLLWWFVVAGFALVFVICSPCHHCLMIAREGFGLIFYLFHRFAWPCKHPSIGDSEGIVQVSVPTCLAHSCVDETGGF